MLRVLSWRYSILVEVVSSVVTASTTENEKKSSDSVLPQLHKMQLLNGNTPCWQSVVKLGILYCISIFKTTSWWKSIEITKTRILKLKYPYFTYSYFKYCPPLVTAMKFLSIHLLNIHLKESNVVLRQYAFSNRIIIFSFYLIIVLKIILVLLLLIVNWNQ